MPAFHVFKGLKRPRSSVKGGKVWTPVPPEDRPHYVSTSVYMTPAQAKQFDESMNKTLKKVLKDLGY